MTLPIPFPIYGYVYNSNNELLAGAEVVISGSSAGISTTTTSEGKYMLNIQDIASENSDINIYSRGYGEHTSGNWSVSLSSPSKKIDIVLEDTLTPGEKILNSYYTINSNECYLFSSLDQDEYLKISDLDW